MLSKEEFWGWFQAAVRSRWGRCEFTTAQLQDWYWRLKGFSTEALTDAVQRHSVCDEPRRPSLKAIHNLVRQQSEHTRGPRQAGQSNNAADTGTYIQCVEHDDRGGGQVGFFVPILIWPFGDHHSKGAIEQAAMHQATLHRQTYGGLWEPIFNTNRSEMLSRRADLQKHTQNSDCTRSETPYNEPVVTQHKKTG